MYRYRCRTHHLGVVVQVAVQYRHAAPLARYCIGQAGNAAIFGSPFSRLSMYVNVFIYVYIYICTYI
jgi:hypothetical protein